MSLIKQDNKIIAGSLIVHSCLIFAYIVFMLAIIGDGETLGVEMLEPAVILTATIVGIEVCAVILVLFSRLLVPHLQRRKAAFKALGEHGIIKAARDPVARIVYKGVYAALEDNFPKAEEQLQLALNRSDSAQNQLFCVEWLIKIYEHINEDSKLLWAFRKAVELAPDNVAALDRLGHAYYVDGRLDSAEYYFRQAIRYDPNDGFSRYSIAKILLIRGEDEKALETMEELVKINESHPLVFAELAVYWAMHDDFEKSEECYKKAVLCGHREQEELLKKIDAIKRFRRGETFDGESLPSEYYRKKEKSENETQAEKD